MIRTLISFILNLAVLIFLLAFIAASTIAVIVMSPELTKKAVEYAANVATRTYLANSVEIKAARFDSKARFLIEDLSASIQTAQGPVKFHVRQIQSANSIINFLRSEGLRLLFEEATFDGSKQAGVSGEILVKGVQNWFVDVSAKVTGLGFEDMVWINPDQLRGTTGNLIGIIDFHAEADREPLLHAELEVKAPGGVMQTQLIRYLFQYLPPVTIKAEVKKLVEEEGLVPYSAARIMTQMEATDRIKVFLFISIPDYNFNLNTNIEIRIDEKNAFGQIAQIFGLIKIGHS